MTAAQASLTAVPTTSDDAAIAAQLWASIGPEFLELMGWSADRRVLYFPQQHPLLGRTGCIVSGCGVAAKNRNGMCSACVRRWTAAGKPPATEFTKTPRRWVASGRGRCAVPRCQRPWTSGNELLCRSHHHQRTQTLKASMAEFLTYPGVIALAAFGPCEVVACTRDRDSTSPYCSNHRLHWNRLLSDSGVDCGVGVDEQRFRRTAAAIPSLNECSLRGIPDRVVAELLFGLERRTAWGAKTRPDQLRPVVARVLANGHHSVEEVEPAGLSESAQFLLNSIVTEVRRARRTPETERVKDEWDTTVFGFTGTLRFGQISQPWLREATKIWAYNDLPVRRSANAKIAVQNDIKYVVMVSESLRLQRPGDHGNDPSALSRSDMCGFLNRMTFLYTNGTVSARTRMSTVRGLRRLLGKMRALGLTLPGQPMHGLPDDFALQPEDVPAEIKVERGGRDLPAEVMRHVCAHLDELEHSFSREVRVAVELIIDTGRRPDEICQLGLNCLDRDAQGKPVLVYTNFKSTRLDCRLPITEPTAALIVEQCERVRRRFPDEPIDKLKLIFSPTRNPKGARPLHPHYVSARHRDWVLTLPDVSLPMAVEIDGAMVTKMLPFDRSKIFLYAYRHTYAQRHADAGVPADVLRELMGHRTIATTQVYYRVGEKRRREAVDRLATKQFDRHGNKIWRDAKALLDSEHLRRAVGEVAVPYGTCSEPSNVAAGGHDCPVRFRCVGCSHFSTDVSYLPDLEGYLADLLRSRERLRGALAADDWAKAEAMPSDEEISRIRRLISRVKADIDELSDEDRAQIEESVTLVRRARNQVVGLGIPRIRQSLPDIRPDRRA